MGKMRQILVALWEKRGDPGYVTQFFTLLCGLDFLFFTIYFAFGSNPPDWAAFLVKGGYLAHTVVFLYVLRLWKTRWTYYVWFIPFKAVMLIVLFKTF